MQPENPIVAFLEKVVREGHVNPTQLYTVGFIMVGGMLTGWFTWLRWLAALLLAPLH